MIHPASGYQQSAALSTVKDSQTLMTTPPKGTNLQEVSQKTYQAVVLKLPSSYFQLQSIFQAVEASMTVSFSIFDLVGDFEEHFDYKY